MELTRCVVEVERPDCEVDVDYGYAGGRYTGTEDVVVVHLGPVQLIGPPGQVILLLASAVDRTRAATEEGRRGRRLAFPNGTPKKLPPPPRWR